MNGLKHDHFPLENPSAKYIYIYIYGSPCFQLSYDNIYTRIITFLSTFCCFDFKNFHFQTMHQLLEQLSINSCISIDFMITKHKLQRKIPLLDFFLLQIKVKYTQVVLQILSTYLKPILIRENTIKILLETCLVKGFLLQMVRNGSNRGNQLAFEFSKRVSRDFSCSVFRMNSAKLVTKVFVVF